MSIRLLVVLALVPQYGHASRMNMSKAVHAAAANGEREPGKGEVVAGGSRNCKLDVWKCELCVTMAGGPKGAVVRDLRVHADAKESDEKCKAAIQAEEDVCGPMENKFIAGQCSLKWDKPCNAYIRTRDRIKFEVENRVITGSIREATMLCEEAVLDVCVKYTGKQFIFAKGVDEDPQTLCEETVQTMLNTTGGYTGDCDGVDKTWAECKKDLEGSLQKAGRHKELEAIMKELTMKCVCVTRLETTELRKQCFSSSSKGNWCNARTPSWENMIKAAEAKQKTPEEEKKWQDDFNGMEPVCRETAGMEMGAMGGIGEAHCACDWAMLGTSPMSSGIIAAVFMAFAGFI